MDEGAPSVDAPEAARLRLAFDLHEAGRLMALERIRRERPGLSDGAIEDAFRAEERSRALPVFDHEPSFLDVVPS